MALINLRNALMTGKRLPYDAEVEYLESTGTQWIDTGIGVKDTLTFRTTCAATATTEQFMGVINSIANRFHFSFYSAGTFRGCMGKQQIDMGAADQSVHTLEIDAPNKLAIKDGTSFQCLWTTLPTGLSIWLFGRNSNYDPYKRYISVRIYSCKIWDNGVLVRDFIPVRKGTVGYLYDRVSGKLFGNAGSGDFVLGPDVVPVEYIESHGTEYIDTGMYLTTSFEYDLKFRMNTPLTSGTKSFGLQYHTWGGSYPMWCIGLTTFNKPRVFANMSAGGNAATGVDVGWNYDTDITMSLHGNTLTYNSTDITFARWENSETSLATMKIFAEEVSRSGGRVLDFAYARCYFLDLYSGNGDSRKFRPVRVGTEGAMMDVLTRRIYRNAGTGAFGYGNDLKYPIPAS